MSQTHVHLIINHLSIIGSFLGVLVLIYGIRVRSTHTQIAAYALFILSSLAAVVTYLTGEAAEETVKNLGGVNKNIIELHEEFSVYALIALIILGIFSIIGIYFIRRKQDKARKIAFIILFFSIICFVLIARTGYLGGQIRHNEINFVAPDTKGSE